MKRRRSDPQATRYRIAVAALARAEKRKAAAEKAIRELRAKVRGYERRLPPERRAEIEAGTKAATATAAANRARWKEAETTLRTAARMNGLSEKDAPLVYLSPVLANNPPRDMPPTHGCENVSKNKGRARKPKWLTARNESVPTTYYISGSTSDDQNTKHINALMQKPTARDQKRR